MNCDIGIPVGKQSFVASFGITKTRELGTDQNHIIQQFPLDETMLYIVNYSFRRKDSI